MPSAKRKLAAIMFTDIVGFTALTQKNEAGAMRMLERHNETLRPFFAKFDGREVKTIGDSFLIEFGSALEALQCAAAIQEGLHKESPDREDSLTIRVGIHLGDVLIKDDGDILGDAVNIASRIQSLADPGGICVTEQVYFQVRNKVSFQFEKLERTDLKNVHFQTAVYRLILPWSETHRREVTEELSLQASRIVILPFTNISPDPSDEYLADGMTEELIDRLAQIPDLKVIARTTAMAFKRSTKRASEIARDLRTGLVIEGSVRRAGSRIRATVQLIDASSEEHLWSSSYDRNLDDIFAIQSDIAVKAAESVLQKLATRSGFKRKLEPYEYGRRETSDVQAYTAYLHGRQLAHERRSAESMQKALGFFEGAIERDPSFAGAQAGLAECHMWLANEGAEPYDEGMKKARKCITKALSLDPRLAEAYSILSLMKLASDDLSGASNDATTAIELNPSLGDPYRTLAQLRGGEGRPEEMLGVLERAYQIDPLNVNVIAFLGHAYLYAGHEQEALEFWQRTLPLVPYRTHCYYAEYHLWKNDPEKARGHVDELEKIRPSDPWTHFYKGYLAAFDGERQVSLRYLANLAEDQSGALAIFLKGFLHYVLGEKDEFYTCMQEAESKHSLPVLELMYAPLFEQERETTRFKEMLAARKRSA